MAAPSTAQICLSVAGKQVWVNPPNFVSLTMKRVAGDSCNSFTLQVLDDSAFTLEYALLNNTGGNISFTYNDYDGKEFKDFTGYVLKISDSFTNNRVMLTLEGFVGVSIQDKFDKYSFAWNVVPRFDWGNVFSDAKSLYGGYLNDMNKDDSSDEDVGNWFSNFFGQGIAGWKIMFNTKNAWKLIGRDPEIAIGTVIDFLKVDEAGNYYLPNMQISNDYSPAAKEKGKNVKQSGSIIVPMRPSKIIKLIGRGGSYSELLEDDFENYKGTSFYNGDEKVSELDWIFIKEWFRMLGKFSGCGWKISDANIQQTDIKEADLTQTKKSFLQYINDILIPNSTITETTEKIVTRDGKTYKQKINTVRTNFLLSFGEDKTVYYKRLNLTNNPKEIVTTYYLYSEPRSVNNKAQDSKYGKLVAFRADLDVLTSMITSGAAEGGDISNLNLVTGETNADYKTEADPDDDRDLTAFTDWGKMRISLAMDADSMRTGEMSLELIESLARAKCYKAYLTIEGPCRLNPQDYIKVCVIPRDKTNGGVLYHHTSGNYYVLQIDESIDSGKQYSTVTVVKNVGSIGNTGERTEIASEIRIRQDSEKSLLEKQVEWQNKTTF